MSEARSRILDTIRRGLGRGPLPEAQQATLRERLTNPPRNLIPARALAAPERLLGLFRDMAEEAAAGITPLSRESEIPAAVVNWLEAQGLPASIVTGEAPLLSSLAWEAAGIQVQRRAARAGDQAALSVAFAGIAETGTLMLLSGPENPSTLNFLPDNHLVVLAASTVVGSYEDAWAELRRQHGSLPRTVNLITGPSRSADIEQKLQMGAHGPIRLQILLLAPSLEAAVR
jgi:L-lactate dehydrogenase complex protein LldG